MPSIVKPNSAVSDTVILILQVRKRRLRDIVYCSGSLA